MNKKIALILFATICLFSFAIYLYITEIQPETANAYSSSKSANGHTWSEMECSQGLCVTPENKVGIGTDSPSEKLEVNGNIIVTVDACNGDNYCLSDLTGFF